MFHPVPNACGDGLDQGEMVQEKRRRENSEIRKGPGRISFEGKKEDHLEEKKTRRSSGGRKRLFQQPCLQCRDVKLKGRNIVRGSKGKIFEHLHVTSLNIRLNCRIPPRIFLLEMRKFGFSNFTVGRSEV
ncbi:hypothetical protein HHI36_009995 [Cryptolaemus montrouzieri]|uniref:Uncharacterized protein n=1 Tax=Cryptolaemus montrouzieri TaxID=559131 RepID=A0ABD2MHV5_9CUCU